MRWTSCGWTLGTLGIGAASAYLDKHSHVERLWRWEDWSSGGNGDDYACNQSAICFRLRSSVNPRTSPL